MTIGIAATGPWAGAGVLAGLRAVEAVGRGAIGGFVSLAVLSADQDLLRAETQNGGAGALFDGPPPTSILKAPFAALISSGPDRPPPLSQFVAAAPGVGLVTGHRFPHIAAEGGQALNAQVLGAMQRGASAQGAIDAIIAAHPGHDAGFIALSAGGALGIGNMPAVLRLANQGAGVSEDPVLGARVATLYNAILPEALAAVVANAVALDEMRQHTAEVVTITLAAGTALDVGPAAEIHVDSALAATRVFHPAATVSQTETAFGLGDGVRVLQQGRVIGTLGLEPFLIVHNGTIASLDGKARAQLPVLIKRSPSP